MWIFINLNWINLILLVYFFNNTLGFFFFYNYKKTNLFKFKEVYKLKLCLYISIEIELLFIDFFFLQIMFCDLFVANLRIFQLNTVFFYKFYLKIQINWVKRTSNLFKFKFNKILPELKAGSPDSLGHKYHFVEDVQQIKE